MKVSSAAIICLICCTGVLGVNSEVSWLPCVLVDEDVSVTMTNYRSSLAEIPEIKLVYKNAVLQFGHPGERQLKPNSTTFLVSGKVDMRTFMTGPVGQLSCKIRRLSRGKAGVRWPKIGGQKHDIWFSCLLWDSRPSTDHMVIISYLRVRPATPMAANRPDFLNWPAISDGDILSASVALVILTRSASVKVSLGQEQQLHCQFAVDHKAPDLTVEWHQRGSDPGRTKLFSYSKRSGKKEGRGVSLAGIDKGDATFTILATKVESEGKYVCSIHVPPIQGHLDMDLKIIEPPSVSFKREGRKLNCEAMGYYPIDVDFKFFKKSSNGSGVIERLGSILHSSHKLHNGVTYIKTAFIQLQPPPDEAGTYICEVTHVSLDKPHRVSIDISASWLDMLLSWHGLATITIIMVLVWCLYRGVKAQREQKWKPI